MNSQNSALAAVDASGSPFAGHAVDELTGLKLRGDGPRPVFDQQVWDLTGLVDRAVQAVPSTLVWDFTRIPLPAWRTVVREYLVALLAPHHELVVALPWARRRKLHVRSCRNRLDCLTGFFTWLAGHGVTHLSEVDQRHCDGYLLHLLDRGLTSGGVLTEVATIKDLARYGELLSADRFADGFLPWPGRSAAVVAGHHRPAGNSTPPVPDHVLRPALHAGLYLVEVLGEHIAGLVEQVAARRGLDRQGQPTRAQTAVLMAEYQRSGRPLPELDEYLVGQRLQLPGWHEGDPLLRLNFSELSRDLGTQPFQDKQIAATRDLIEAAVRQCGLAPRWTGDVTVEAADGSGPVTWTEPLTTNQVDDLAVTAFGTCLFVATTLSGMRSSELMELTSLSCPPPREIKPGLFRYRLTSKRIKGEDYGGVEDHWVVIEPAFRAVQLATRLLAASAVVRPGKTSGESVFGRFEFTGRFDTFRRWVNGPAGVRLGLPPIPDGKINPRMLRRTLALELAHRPHGLLAAKVHLKHISVATTEGYSHRPGGAQARFHAEMVAEQQRHHRQLTVDAYRDYQQGQLPAGPGARSLIAAFEHVDGELAKQQRSQPTMVPTDRHIELLLKKRAATLHVQPANYCWFTDPGQALCLKLAGTPTADQPLAGLCDAARCPQATFHARHRDVWASCAKTTEQFLGNPRVPAGEKTRLAREHDRAQRVLTAIDTADTDQEHR